MNKRTITILLAAPLLCVAGIVALLAVPAPAHVIHKAKLQQTQSQLKDLSSAITCMEIDGLPAPRELGQLDKKYYEGSLTDSWENPILYDPTNRTLTAPGPDCKSRTGDDISLVIHNKP